MRSEGNIGAAQLPRPVKRRYYTLSMWQSEEALKAFAGSQSHRRAAGALRGKGPVAGVLMSWWAPASAPRPRWAEVMRVTFAGPVNPQEGPDGG